jgi:hypothetical protein
MSGPAEKLKALEAPLASISRIEVEGPMAQAVFILGSALPELIALVEAAEAVKDHDDNDPRPLRPTLELLYGEVAALDAKLGEQA